jgi:GT2 family glycosyltransferase
MNPFISIVVLNFNGKKWIHNCLVSLQKQTYTNYEVIFVDNGSTDGSIEYAKKFSLNLKVVLAGKNLGIAGGNNLGYKNSKGKYILLLNNDIRLDSDYLVKFVLAIKKLPQADIIQSKLVIMDDPSILDSCGSFWTNSSFLYHYGNGKKENLDIYNTSFPVFTVKSASVLIKKSVIDRIGLYDDEYFAYYEETDFCHRAWLAGYQCWYWPNTKIYHALGGTSLSFNNDFIQFHNFKNKLLSFLTNFEVVNLLYIIPEFIILNILIGFGWLAQGKYKHMLSLYKAIWWNLKNIKRTLLKRNLVQKLRKRSDSEIFSIVRINPKLIYYFYLFKDQIRSYIDLPVG